MLVYTVVQASFAWAEISTFDKLEIEMIIIAIVRIVVAVSLDSFNRLSGPPDNEVFVTE